MVDGTDEPRAKLALMSEREFLAAWKRVFGQPPAALLDRGSMIDLLLTDGPATVMRRERDRLRVRAAAWGAPLVHLAEARPRRWFRGT